jgi:hypothetical protein
MKRNMNFPFGIKMKILISLIMTLFLVNLSCEKKAEIRSTVQITETVCYPDDNIYVTFSVIPEGGSEPYQIKWYEPADFEGPGPFSVNLTADLTLDFEIRDSEGALKRFSNKIDRDTIDSLKYDYRNRYAAVYCCDVMNYYAGNVKYYKDTLTVTKADEFRNLTISNKSVNWGMIYLDSNQFFGYHSGVTFNNDSISFSESGPLGYYYTNTYTGIKLKMK